VPRHQPIQTDSGERTIAYERVYHELYTAIISGHYAPGQSLTIRGLAEELGMSPMPVREAVRRLVAMGALEMRTTRRVAVCSLTESSFHEICKARKLLEPELAAQALPQVTTKLITRLRAIDQKIDQAIESGDADRYSYSNWEFHFTLYRLSHSDLFLDLVETLWLRFGPFMRVVVGRIGTSLVVDQHQQMLQALEHKDETGLREAVRLDICDGMQAIGDELFGQGVMVDEGPRVRPRGRTTRNRSRKSGT